MKEPVFIAGACGRIGSALTSFLRSRGARVIETSRRKDPSRLHIDLAHPESWPELPDARTAVITAAMTSMNDCALDPETAHTVNSTGAIELARRLTERGAYVVLLSTNQVFDGSIPYRGEEELPEPVTSYGATKAAGEEGILALGPKTAVLRLSKVLTPNLPMLTSWREALHRGEPARAFHDMSFSPVTLRYVCELVEMAITACKPGVFHASGDVDLSYADLAKALVSHLGLNPARVECISVEDSNVPTEAAPRHATLGMRRTESELGIGPQDSWSVVRSVLDELLLATPQTESARVGR